MLNLDVGRRVHNNIHAYLFYGFLPAFGSALNIDWYKVSLVYHLVRKHFDYCSWMSTNRSFNEYLLYVLCGTSRKKGGNMKKCYGALNDSAWRPTEESKRVSEGERHIESSRALNTTPTTTEGATEGHAAATEGPPPPSLGDARCQCVVVIWEEGGLIPKGGQDYWSIPNQVMPWPTS